VLKGALPDSLRNATRLAHLNLAQNDLRGDLPVAALSQLPLAELYLTHNRLADPAAQGAELQANLPACRVSVDEFGYVRGNTPDAKPVAEAEETNEALYALSEMAANAFFEESSMEASLAPSLEPSRSPSRAAAR